MKVMPYRITTFTIATRWAEIMQNGILNVKGIKVNHTRKVSPQ